MKLATAHDSCIKCIGCIVIPLYIQHIIGTSLSEPHTNEKIAVLMYVCMYVAIRQTRAR